MCGWFAGAILFETILICKAQGWPVILAGACAGLIVLYLCLWALRGAHGRAPRMGVAPAAASAILLSLAAGLPMLQQLAPPSPGGRVVVLLDVSESMRRTGDDALQAARDKLASQLRRLAQDLPVDADWRGSVWAIGAVPRAMVRDAALADLAAGVTRADPGPVASQSDLAAGLAAGLRDIGTGPGAGLVLLVTDGHQTHGDLRRAAQSASQAAVPVHVLATGAAAPGAGLLSLDLGPDQAIGRQAVVRATILGDGVLRWGINGQPEPALDLSAPVPRAVRIPVGFAQRGLNFVSLGFGPEGQAAGPDLAYTLVRGPARVLVYGAAPWIDSADRQAFVIVRAAPGDDVVPGMFDAVVIDALSPDAFAADMPARLLAAASGGTGLFVVNGPLRGTPQDRQRLADWEATALGPILPVNSDPGTYLAAPPKRDLLIIIDTSGSMEGANLQVAQAAALQIIDAVRPQDSLTIVPFSDAANPVFSAAVAGPEETAAARRFIGDLVAQGGTNMAAAIDQARQLRGNHCALFIIGDGGYEAGQIKGSPICHTTAIGVQGRALPGIDTRWGQQIPLRPGAQLGPITFAVFQPEPRTTFWQDGPFNIVPVQMPSALALDVPLAGAALSYPRPESRDLSVMSDPPRAPVLAFRQDPALVTLRSGVFLGAVPQGLPAGPDGWATAVLRKLVGWTRSDLFDIALGFDGADLRLRITPLTPGADPLVVAASVLLPDGTSTGIAMNEPDRFGAITGTGRITLSNNPTRGILVLDVANSDVQAIPLHLPARGAFGTASDGTGERGGFGVDMVVLDEVMATTGGLDLTQGIPKLVRDAVQPPVWPLWPWLAGLAALAFAASLFAGGIRR